MRSLCADWLYVFSGVWNEFTWTGVVTMLNDWKTSSEWRPPLLRSTYNAANARIRTTLATHQVSWQFFTYLWLCACHYALLHYHHDRLWVFFFYMKINSHFPDKLWNIFDLSMEWIAFHYNTVVLMIKNW